MSNPQDKVGIFRAAQVSVSSSTAGGTQVVGRGQRDSDPLLQARGVNPLDTSRGERSRPHQHGHHGEGDHAHHGCLPKLQSPVLSGEDPQLWCSRCENYFDMYEVELSMWVRVASMHMEGSAAH
jgi:hypothetical protein